MRLIYSGNFVAKLVFARRIFPALGNANEFSLLSLNGKIVMSKTAYHITLKGYVGGYDFDRSTVDKELAKNEGKQVNVLIDSLQEPRQCQCAFRRLERLGCNHRFVRRSPHLH